jgi:hypothetical protein
VQYAKISISYFIRLFRVQERKYLIINDLIIVTTKSVLSVVIPRLDRGIQKTTGCPLEPVPAGRKRGTCWHDKQETVMDL